MKPIGMLRWGFSVALALLLAMALGFDRPAHADVYSVATPEELQAAIDDAQNTIGPDTIHLAATIFHIDSSTIGSVGLGANDFQGPNGITLIGAGASATILQGGGPTDPNTVVAIFGTSLMTIENMTIENGGIGIYNNGNLVLRDSVVRNNGQSGIETVNRGLAIFGSTISGNATSLTGNFGEGGIYVESDFSAVNSTITGNHAAGIFVDFTNHGASLRNVTIDGNAGPGLDVHAAITITNSIVADNAGGDCAPSPPGRAVSGGHNLVGDLTCGFTAAGDLNGVSPKLGPLQNNGGPTPTVAPAFDSPAIDAADGGACPGIDQRGIARPQGAACDIGAFELVPNDAPTCVDYANSTFIATPLSDVVACSDPDAGDTFTVAQVSGPSNGVLTLNADGTFTYVPSSGFAGTDSVTFQATDSRGALSNVATATITIPDRSPNCPDYTGTVYLERTLDGSVGCTDPDAGDTLTVSLVSAVSHGILTLAADGTFIYTPAGGFLGTDTFAYQATDSFGALSAVGNAIITVSSRPPTCQNFSGSVLSGVTLSVGTETNVICTDPDGDTFTYSVVTGPAHGLAFISFRGTGFEYASSRTYIGSDSFTYTATDMHGIVSNIATATIQVVDTAPTCLNLTASVGAGGSLPLLQLLSRSCSDPDPFDSLTYSFVTNPAHGTLNIAGGLAYLANSSYLGPDSFTYQATDSRGVVSNVGTATIQVVNTGTGINVEVFPDPSVYLSFRNVGTAGTTTAVPSTTGPASPAGFQIPGGSLYWEISTTATYALQGIEVCISAPAGVANPRLLHYQGGAWVDVTTRLSGTFVCGSVASLSPFVVAIPVSTQSFSNLAYTGGTTAVFGPLAMSARLTNATTHAGLGARSVTFSVDGGAPIAATTSADGTATATTPLPLAPGSHMVDVGFAGDQSSLASSVHATVIVSSSSRGSVDANGLKPVTGGPINLKVHADSNRLKGHLHYDDGPRGSKPLEAKTMIAFGVAADGDSAWVAAVDKEGHSFLVHAVDTGHGKQGVDTLTLWIDGVLQTGDGALRAGDVRIDPDQ